MNTNNSAPSICILGASTTTNNMGVSALAVSIVNIFRKLCPKSDLRFLIGSRSSAPQRITTPEGDIFIPTITYRLSPKTKYNNHLFIVFIAAIFQKFFTSKWIKEKIINHFPVLKTIYNSDIIADIHGGDSFSDIYGLRGFLISTIPLFITILLNKRLILLPQTYGPFTSWISKISRISSSIKCL